MLQNTTMREPRAVRVGRGEGPEPIEFTREGATELERIEGLVERLQLAARLRG